VADSLVVPAGTLVIVRPATDVSSATAGAGDRFQGFLDQDLATGGRLVAPRGGRVYGIVTAANRGQKTLSVSLTDVKVGDAVVPITTQPLSVQGKSGGPAVVRGQTPQSFTVSAPFRVDIMTNVAVR
jgi:hypothetical protein